jgi:hypothetical protein
MILPQVHLRNGEFSCGDGWAASVLERDRLYLEPRGIKPETRHHLVCEQHLMARGLAAGCFERRRVVTVPELVGSATLGAPQVCRRAWYLASLPRSFPQFDDVAPANRMRALARHSPRRGGVRSLRLPYDSNPRPCRAGREGSRNLVTTSPSSK